MKREDTGKYHHGNLRAELLKAGLSLLDEEGPEGVTVRAVARVAGVSHSAPANHFPHRRSLMTALAADIFRCLADDIANALNRAPALPAERIRAIAETVMTFGLSAPNRYRLLWRRDLLDHEEPELEQAMERIYQQLVEELKPASRHLSHDVHTNAIALWSMVHGYISMRLEGMFVAKVDSVSGEPRGRAIITAFLRTLRPHRQ